MGRTVQEFRYSLDKVASTRRELAPRSKTEATMWRDRLRAEIRAGAFVDPDDSSQPAAAEVRITFGDVCEQYLKRHVQSPLRRPRGRREMEILIAMLRRAEIPAAHGTTIKLESKPIADVTRADIEAVRAWRRQVQSEGGRTVGVKGGEVGINRLLSRMRHLCSWAVVEGHLSETPFKRGSVAVVKMEASVESARTRRLLPSMPADEGAVKEGEEVLLLKHAGPHLRALIVAGDGMPPWRASVSSMLTDSI
jgi:hypothetical protein